MDLRRQEVNELTTLHDDPLGPSRHRSSRLVLLERVGLLVAPLLMVGCANMSEFTDPPARDPDCVPTSEVTVIRGEVPEPKEFGDAIRDAPGLAELEVIRLLDTVYNNQAGIKPPDSVDYVPFFEHTRYVPVEFEVRSWIIRPAKVDTRQDRVLIPIHVPGRSEIPLIAGSPCVADLRVGVIGVFSIDPLESEPMLSKPHQPYWDHIFRLASEDARDIIQTVVSLPSSTWFVVRAGVVEGSLGGVPFRDKGFTHGEFRDRVMKELDK